MSGTVWKFGDNVDTDVLAPGTYMKGPLEELATHCLESVDPQFAAGVQAGDFVVAGRNFGAGSSREQAAQVLKLLGVAAVIAPSFAGIFYRNACNLGLAALISDSVGRIASGQRLSVDVHTGVMENLTTGERLTCEPLPEHLAAIVQAGGLIPYLQNKLETER
ncbi:MAG: 3-isopropylmalate dehydratase [Gammaproteobacteria bacterium]|nr:3-isopropylmalate dehydratase [Gammaproteobacteria bacterium]